MPTRKQRQASRKNARKTPRRLQGSRSGEVMRSRPQGRSRRRAGGAREGDFYQIEVRPKTEFVTFRTQDVGRKGHVQRVAGKRSGGTWSTATWLIAKGDAHVSDDRLVGDTPEAKEVIEHLGMTPIRIQGDRFMAKDRPGTGEPRRREAGLAEPEQEREELEREPAPERRPRAETEFGTEEAEEQELSEGEEEERKLKERERENE